MLDQASVQRPLALKTHKALKLVSWFGGVMAALLDAQDYMEKLQERAEEHAKDLEQLKTQACHWLWYYFSSQSVMFSR